MKPGVYFIQLGDDRRAPTPVKIGYSVSPKARLSDLCNYHEIDGVMLAHAPGPPILEYEIHDQLAKWRLGFHGFWLVPEVAAMIAKYKIDPIYKKYEKRSPDHSRRKVPPVIMTPKRIALAGDYLNGRNGKPKLSGPKVAKKLGVSTASIYGFWKQSGRGRFVRKKPQSE